MATNINVGSAYLTIIPSARGFVRELKKELGKEGFHKYGALLGKQIEKGFQRSQVTTKIKRSFTNMFTSISSLGKSGMLDGLIASALAAVSAVAPLSGLLVALPGVAVAAGAAFAVLKTALNGVGAAFTAAGIGDAQGFNEVLAELTTSAGIVNRELAGLFFGINDLMQESLFEPMVTASKGLTKELKGPLQEGLAAVAASLGDAGANVLYWAKSAEGAAVIEGSMKQAAKFISEASQGIPTLLQGILDLAHVTLGDWGQALADTFHSWGNWLSEIAKDGRAQEWFNNAIAVSKDLIQVGEDIGRTFVAIFSASSSDGGLLDALMRASSAMATWAESAKGQEAINAIFQFFGTVASEVVVALGTLVHVLALVATWFNSLSPETQSTIASFLAWSIVLGPLSGRLIAIATLLTGVSRALWLVGSGLVGAARASVGFIRGMVGGTTALTAKSTAANRAGAAVSRFIGWLGKGTLAVLKWTGALIASAARATASFIASLARGTAAMAMNAARQTAIGLRMAAAQIAAAARVVAAWVVMGTQALIHGARIAAGWILAMGPIGWIIAAVVALAVLIFAYWDEIAAFLSTAWNWIKGIAESVWGAISDFFTGWWNNITAVFNAAVALISNHLMSQWNGIKAVVTVVWNAIKTVIDTVWNAIKTVVQTAVNNVMSTINGIKAIINLFKDWFNRAKDGAVEKLTSMVSWLLGLKDRILGAIGNLGSTLYNAGRDLLMGLKDGIMSAWESVKSTLSDLTDKLPDWKGPASKDRKLFVKPAKLIMGGLEDTFKDEAPRIKSILQGLTSDIEMTATQNVRGVEPPPVSSRGVNIDNFNVNAADNRFSADQLYSQVKMVVS